MWNRSFKIAPSTVFVCINFLGLCFVSGIVVGYGQEVGRDVVRGIYVLAVWPTQPSVFKYSSLHEDECGDIHVEGTWAQLLRCWRRIKQEVSGCERLRRRNNVNTLLWQTNWNYGFLNRYSIIAQVLWCVPPASNLTCVFIVRCFLCWNEQRLFFFLQRVRRPIVVAGKVWFLGVRNRSSVLFRCACSLKLGVYKSQSSWPSDFLRLRLIFVGSQYRTCIRHCSGT